MEAPQTRPKTHESFSLGCLRPLQILEHFDELIQTLFISRKALVSFSRVVRPSTHVI